MAKKKNKSKMSVSVKKSKGQQKGHQKQSQSISVNIDLGKKGRARSKITNPKIPLQPQFPPNYPPFYNPNMPNWLIPPPIPQKQYIALPESETAIQLGLLPNVPVPLTVEGSPLKEKKDSRLEQYTVINEPFKAPTKEEYTVIEPAPAPAPAPEFIAEQPALFPAGEEQLLPPEPASLTESFKPAQFPAEPPSPSGSTLSGLSEFTPAYSEVGVSLVKRPKPIDLSLVPRNAPERLEGYNLSKVSQSLPLPPIGPSAQPLVSSGLTAYNQPSNFPPEYLFEEGATAPAPEKPKKKKGLAAFIEGAPEPVKEKKKRGPKGPRQPKYEATVPAGQTQFAVPVKETSALAIPAEGTYSLSAPLSQQPSAVFLGGTEKTVDVFPFSEKIASSASNLLLNILGEPSIPPEKVSGGLERKRGGVAITPAEQTLLSNPLGNPPLFA